MRNKFKLAYQLIIRGKWTMKIITILLSAFSFALFALASTAYTYSERDYIVRSYLYDLKQDPQLAFSGGGLDDKGALRPEDIELIKETFQLDFLYKIICGVDFGHFVSGYFLPDDDDTDFEFKGPIRILDSTVSEVVSGSEELFQKAGYELLEGRYPTAENEIAVDVSIYADFEWGGYSDNFEYFDANGYDGYDDNFSCNASVEINSYSDLIGKRLVAWENQDTTYLYPERTGDTPQEVVIVGIYDTPNPTSESSPFETLKTLTQPKVIRSLAWQKVREQNQPLIHAIFVPNISDILDKKLVKKCLDVTETMLERFHERYKYNPNWDINYGSIGAIGMTSYFNNVEDLNLDLLAEIFAGAGFVFLIFSVILNAYLLTAIMKTKSKQVGLLRAFGTPKRKIAEIFLMGICILAAIIFIVALIITASAYFGFLRPWLLDGGRFGVPAMQFNGWTVLILFGVSFITPVLSVLFPIRKFFKSSIVDNLKGTSTKKRKGGRNVRSK